MNTKSPFLLFVLFLLMGVFHQCNVDEDPNPVVSTQPLFKIVEIENDQNLRNALQQLSLEDSAACMLPKIYAPYAILGRDITNNLIHYTLPIYKDLGSGFQNLVVTLTPNKDVYARVFSYTNEDPEQSYSGMDNFNGDLVISDIYGNQQFESSITNGQQNPEYATNAKTAGSCTITTYYTKVSGPYGTTTKIDAVNVSCTGGGSVALPIGSSTSASALGIEYGGGGNNGGGVAVMPLTSNNQLSAIIGRLCDNIKFKLHADQGSSGGAFSASISDVAVTAIDYNYAQPNAMIHATLGTICVTIPGRYLSTSQNASTAFVRAYNGARQQVMMGLNDGSIDETSWGVKNALKRHLELELNYRYGGSKVSSSSCGGSIPHTRADYGC